MTIKARYAGTCKRCGGRINAGDTIEWERGSGASHLECPKVEDAPYRLSGGSGYGYRGWDKGQVVQASKRLQEQGYPEWLFVVSTSERYIREDGMSFGVGDESGYIYRAMCREATSEEAAPMIARLKAEEAKRQAASRVKEIAATIKRNGERPEYSDENARGDHLIDTQTIYGTGDWFVVSEDWIWYVRNHGSDGDDWSLNNVRTGGAGAIGWKIPFDEALAAELKELEQMLNQSK